MSLAPLLHEAAEAHHAAEERLPAHEWEDWYGEYLEQRMHQATQAVAIERADRAIILKGSI